jgi:hypothetical protein
VPWRASSEPAVLTRSSHGLLFVFDAAGIDDRE